MSGKRLSNNFSASHISNKTSEPAYDFSKKDKAAAAGKNLKLNKNNSFEGSDGIVI